MSDKNEREIKKCINIKKDITTMSQFCYDIKSEGNYDVNELKLTIRKNYRNKRYEEYFEKDEPLPFIVIASKDKICIRMTSRSLKVLERINNIHSQIKKKIVTRGGIKIVLSKPYMFKEDVCEWWKEDVVCELKKGQKWATLEHSGPYFTHIMEPYEPHKVPLMYGKKKIKLKPETEMFATFYARRLITDETSAIKMTTDKVYNKNFWEDFKGYLTPTQRTEMKDFSKLNFSKIVDHIKEKKEADKQLSKEEKDKKRVKTEEKRLNHGYAMINGFREKVGGYIVERAAIFQGRGANPLRGRIKRDVEPEEVTINITEGARVPPAPKGHKWGKVIHEQEDEWLASWKDPLTNQNKYIRLAAAGQLKGKNDFMKFEKARKLNYYLDRVREKYEKDINSSDMVKRQLGTVLYLIDRYGIRVGNESAEDETDTVGASTLLVSHVDTSKPNTVIFDFLGKDSVRYHKEIPVSEKIYENVKSFQSGKKRNESLFDRITASDINAYLKTFDKHFSAKVFRTKLATSLFYDELEKQKKA